MILGLDPSIANFGWVLLDETKQGVKALLSHGTFKTDPTDGLLVQRLILQRERVRKIIVDNKVTFISMESPFFGGASTEILYALNQFIHEVFLELDIFVLYLQPTRIKKYACPTISANEVTKNHMVHQAKTELDMHGRRFSEHCADAYFAGKLGSVFYNWYILKTLKDEDLPDYLLEIFAGKHKFTRGVKKSITEYNGIIYKENEHFFDYKKQIKKTQTIREGVNNVREKVEHKGVSS